MCSCEINYNLACVRRDAVWMLYHRWYNRATTPSTRRDTKTDLQLFFNDYPDILRGINEGKQIKVLLYSKLRAETRRRLVCFKRVEWHHRFNSFGDVFYVQTRVSPTFLFRRVSEYVGNEV